MSISKQEDAQTTYLSDQSRSLISRDLLGSERNSYIARHSVIQLLPTLPYKMLVVIPAFNEAEGIEGTLQTLLDQTNQNFAVTVVDNGSTDGTQEKVKKFIHHHSVENMFLLEETKKGVAYARKRGMDQAVLPSVGNIQFIACTDADTRVTPDWIERFYQAFEQNSADVLTGEIYFFEDKGVNDLFFIDQARAALMRYIRPSLNGANFAIKMPSYVRVDGIEQPVTPDGIPLQGSDRHLAYKILENDGEILHVPLRVSTNPRRYISLMIDHPPTDGTIYGSNGMTDIRNPPSLVDIKNLPSEIIEVQVERMLKSLFAVYVCQTYTIPVNRKKYWDKTRQLLFPFENEFMADVAAISSNDKNPPENLLWEKYRQVFLTRLSQLVKYRRVEN